MRKTPAVAYYTRKIRTTSRKQILDEIEEAPLRRKERYFLYDILEGLTYKELADKYCKSEARIASWKRELFEKMHRLDMQKL